MELEINKKGCTTGILFWFLDINGFTWLIYDLRCWISILISIWIHSLHFSLSFHSFIPFKYDNHFRNSILTSIPALLPSYFTKDLT